MEYRKLGSTDLNLSVVGIGTWQFGGEWGKDFTQKEVDQMLFAAHEEGMNFIDTAECYGDHLSERMIGEFMKHHNREDWVIATKFGHHFHGKFDRTRHISKVDVCAQLDRSLKALNTEYIDLYQAHSLTDDELNNDDLFTMLDKQKQAGKIRHIGLSLQNEPSMTQAKRAKSLGVEAFQLIYNRLTRDVEETIFKVAEADDIGILARVPLASGYLSGKYTIDATFTNNDVRSRHDQLERINKLKDVAKIKKEEVPSGVDMATWALNWCLKNKTVTSVIPGCKNVDQVRKNASAYKLS